MTDPSPSRRPALPRSRDGGTTLRPRPAGRTDAGRERADAGRERADAGRERADAGREPQSPDGPGKRSTWLLWSVRYALPAVVTVAGLVMMGFGSDIDLEGGASLISAGLAIYFV